MMLTIKIYEGDREIASKSLGEGAFRAGRSEFCDLVLPGTEVSRSHLEIRVTGNTAYITNMSGAGRVKVNGERIETAELKAGDQIEIAQYRLVAIFGDGAAMEAPAALD